MARKAIQLPEGTEHVRFGDLAEIIAEALHAGGDWAIAGARVNLESELKQAVRDGTLPVKDPLTLGSHTFPIGQALSDGRVLVADLRDFVRPRGIDVKVMRTAAEIEWFSPMFERLSPRTPWAGGRMVDTDVLTLVDAATMATKHAGEPVTIGDFLRAAARGEITLRAIVHHTAKVQAHDGGIYCNAGQENENKVPAGAIATLPLTACRHLAAAGRASWRTFDGFETRNGGLQRYTAGQLVAGEPDFETVPEDCRVVGYDVHALADEYTAPEAQQTEPVCAVPAADESAIDLSKLATRDALINAFGAFTGMSANWFDNITDSPRLLHARKVAGQGGRGRTTEPWFCPVEVMQWLIDPKRRKGRCLSVSKGWELLEKNFPKAYNAVSMADPRED